MRERLPSRIAFLLLAALVLASWWAADYTQRAVVLDPPRRMTHEPDAWGKDVVILRSDPQGVAIQRMQGQTIQHYPDDDSTEILQMRASGREMGDPFTVASSDVAVLDQDGNRITLRGNAVVQRHASAQTLAMRIQSEELILRIPENEVSTHKPAVATYGRSVLRGVGMQYSHRTKILHVHAAVDAKIARQEQYAH